MRQFSADDAEAAVAKEGLYKQDADGKWSVDPEKEALRMANHTRCYHKKPSLDEEKDAVTKQFWSGEGAIQYVPEMVARANADLLTSDELKKKFLHIYEVVGRDEARLFLKDLATEAGEPTDDRIMQHRMDRYGLNPCGEIALRDNLCNLSEIHLNTIGPKDLHTQNLAFYVGGLQVAALLKHEFVPERLKYSRINDPIVGVSFTGLFDFFVHAFGAPWLKWMMEGRPSGYTHAFYETKEAEFLKNWRHWAEQGVRDYCQKAGIRVPNRFTTVQPAGSKSLLTGASPGWHPPKAQRFIRRITFGVEDPLVSALQDYGYSVIPAQSARDENGNLLDDIKDPRVREVLVEIPTEVSWANLPGCDEFDLSQLPVSAQWGLYMQVQNHYTTHNTSATLEYRENEIDSLSELIYQNIQEDGGYISAALLARFDANETFPRLPFEPVNKETYERLHNIVLAKRSVLSDDTSILDILKGYDNSAYELKGAAGCDSDKCLVAATKDDDQVGKAI
jgi:ribonucleotide reductase class II